MKTLKYVGARVAPFTLKYEVTTDGKTEVLKHTVDPSVERFVTLPNEVADGLLATKDQAVWEVAATPARASKGKTVEEKVLE